MSVSEGKHLAFHRGRELKCESIQVFIRNVRSWATKPLDQKDIDKFLKAKEEFKDEIWPVISHDSYLINLASIDNEKLEKSYNAMLDELTKATQLNIEYENMHPGVIPVSDKEKITKEEAFTQIATQLNRLIDETKGSKVRILLETTAGQGKGLGNKFHHFKKIIDKLPQKIRKFCYKVKAPFSAAEVKQIVSNLNIVLSSRMHLAISCLSQSTPVASITLIAVSTIEGPTPSPSINVILYKIILAEFIPTKSGLRYLKYKIYSNSYAGT